LRNKSDPVQAYRFFAILRKTLGIYLKSSFRVNLLNENTFDPPYILIGNHVTSYDPFIMAAYTGHPVNYVTSDSYFRNPFLRFLLDRLGSIPKTKFMTDTATVKAMMSVIKKGGIVGVFPEGARSWDGHTLPLIYSTAKLIKLMKTDVIAARMQGAMFTMPRWSRFRKKGMTFLSFEKVLAASDMEGMSTSDIYSRITAAVSHDEYDFQRDHMNIYIGRKPAERLERFLYICPSCMGFHTMYSKKDIFTCRGCGYTVRYNEYGFFEGNGLLFDSTRQWNIFQQEKIADLLNSGMEFTAREILVHACLKDCKKTIKNKADTMHFSGNGFYLAFGGKRTSAFDIGRISGLNVQADQLLEFYAENVLYRISFAGSDMSAYAAKKIIAEIIGRKEVKHG